MIKAFQPGDYRPGERVTCKSVQGESAPPSAKESQDVVDWGSHDKPDQDLIGVAFKPPQPGMASMSSLTLQARQAYAAAMSLSIMGDPMENSWPTC